MSCSTSPAPVELKLTNDPDGFDPFAVNVVTLGFGDPAQVLKSSPATSFSNSGVHVVAPCSNTSNPDCGPARYGRIYDSTGSTTYAAASFGNWNGSHNAGQTTITSTYFNERVKLGDNAQLYGAPIVTLDNLLAIPNVFGIGPNSTLISQAFNNGLITSNSWSLYTGNTTSPGSLILGGYSDQFVNGNLTGRASDPSCPLCFQINSITFDNADGSTPILTSDQGPFMAQLEPFANWLAFPSNVFNNWLDVTNSGNTIQDFAVYNTSAVPDGRLTITLGNGIRVTIPHTDLFTTNRLNGNGSLLTPPTGNTIAKVRRSAASTGILGLPYMSHVYLVYDNDRQRVNISNVVPGATSNNVITRICPLATSSTPLTPSATAINSTDSAGSPHSSSPSYAGAIAGGVVGFIALLVTIVVILFLVLRHKRKESHRRLNSYSSHGPLEKDSNGAIPLFTYAQRTQDDTLYREVTKEPVEMYHRPKVEMPAESHTYELPSSNMKGPADLDYERYELSSESAADGGTINSWDGSTIPTNKGIVSPNTPHLRAPGQATSKWI